MRRFRTGGGGAVTSFNGYVSATRADVLGVDTAGIEAAERAGRSHRPQAIVAGSLPYREAWLYLESRLDGLGYIRSVSPHSSPGHDVKAFLDDFNEGCDPPVCTPLPASTLKRRALLILRTRCWCTRATRGLCSYLVLGRSSARTDDSSAARERELSASPAIP